MSIVTALQCEICQKTYQLDPQFISFEDWPTGWFSLRWKDGTQRIEDHDFCSISCLKQWAIKGYPDLPPAYLARIGEQGPRERAYFEAQKE